MPTPSENRITEYFKGIIQEVIANTNTSDAFVEGEYAGEIRTASDYRESLRSLYKEGLKPGPFCGWESLRDYYRPRKGEFTVLTGIPSHGKSTFLDDMMINLTKSENWKFGVFSAENMPMENYISRLIAKFSGFPFMQGPHARITEGDMDRCITAISDRFFLLDPDEDKRNVTYLLQLAGYLVNFHKIDGFVIDPWNELDHTRPAWMSETEYTSKALSQIRFFARRNHIHIWLVAHPAKMYPDKDGKIPKPGLYSISGSAHFRNKCDMGLMVWRDIENELSETEIHILKVRFSENGKVGKTKLWFDKSTGKYFDR